MAKQLINRLMMGVLLALLRHRLDLSHKERLLGLQQLLESMGEYMEPEALTNLQQEVAALEAREDGAEPITA